MRIIHTSDIHLDACFSASAMPPRYGNRRRQSLREVFQRILRYASEYSADAVVIAGDLFDHERISRDTVAFLKREFQKIAPLPVVIAPGNHDPYVPDSPYATESWPENVTIFHSPEWHSVKLCDGGLVIHGFAFDGPDISENPFGKLTIQDDTKEDAVHIAVGHGSERGHQPAEKQDYAPFDAADAAVPALAYLALGHYHGLTPIEGDFETVIYYCGAPEGHGFNEPGEHYFLDVELRPNSVDITPVPSARVLYETQSMDCSGYATSQELIDGLRKLARKDPRPMVARVTFTGETSLHLDAELAAVYDTVSPEFEFLQLVDKTDPIEDYDKLAAEDTSLGGFVRALNEEINDAADTSRRQFLMRTRQIGVAAYRQRPVTIQGMDGDAPTG